MGEIDEATMANRSMTGIDCADECAGILKEIQRRKLRWALFGFNDKRDLIIPLAQKAPMCAEKDLTMEIIRQEWEEMADQLPPNDVRYCVYDFAYKDIQSGYSDGDVECAPVKSKVALIQWSPDSAKVKVKMLVPSSVASIRAEAEAANIASVNVQMNCHEDTVFEAVCDTLNIKLA